MKKRMVLLLSTDERIEISMKEFICTLFWLIYEISTSNNPAKVAIYYSSTTQTDKKIADFYYDKDFSEFEVNVVARDLGEFSGLGLNTQITLDDINRFIHYIWNEILCFLLQEREGVIAKIYMDVK